jgi:hypothetical protein
MFPSNFGEILEVITPLIQKRDMNYCTTPQTRLYTVNIFVQFCCTNCWIVYRPPHKKRM